jgi:hypothetical protein
MDVDALYGAFEAELPETLRPLAANLPGTLGLAPRGTRWSKVFAHGVTLGAPALVAEAMPLLPANLVKCATSAHLLAVVEAFTTDRIEDGQVQPTQALTELVERLRRARDIALSHVSRGVTDDEVDGRRADAVTLGAIRSERQILASAVGTDFPTYLAVSAAKQRVGLPASLALAHAAGWDARRRSAIRTMLEDVWLGLQLADDVVDWEEDTARGGSWAVSLAWHEHAHRPSRERETLPPIMSRFVHASGVLPRMLHAARRRFRAAARLATAMGMNELAVWARGRELHVQRLASDEEAAPGYALRARALDAWAKQVLS